MRLMYRARSIDCSRESPMDADSRSVLFFFLLKTVNLARNLLFIRAMMLRAHEIRPPIKKDRSLPEIEFKDIYTPRQEY